MKKLKEKDCGTALVTGASSGMGYEYALQLAGRTHDLVIVSNEKEKLEEMASGLREKYAVKVWPVFMDLARPEAPRELYDFCKKENLIIDILINNAGIFFFGEVVETNPEKAGQIIHLHSLTPSLICLYFGKDMKARRRGFILNMSSMSAWMPYPGLAFYAATKMYLRNFSRSLRAEMIDYGVSVTYVCPGAVATNLFDRNKLDYKKAMKYGLMMPAGKVARSGLKALFKGRAVLVPGWLNKLIVMLVCITPHGLILFIKRHTKLIPAS